MYVSHFKNIYALISNGSALETFLSFHHTRLSFILTFIYKIVSSHFSLHRHWLAISIANKLNAIQMWIGKNTVPNEPLASDRFMIPFVHQRNCWGLLNAATTNTNDIQQSWCNFGNQKRRHAWTSTIYDLIPSVRSRVRLINLLVVMIRTCFC